MSTPTFPTASLSPSGQAAMQSLQLRLAPAPLVLAVNVYRTASARTAELSAVTNTRDLTASEADYLAHVQDMMAGAQAALAAAGRLDLIAVSA